MHTPEDPWELHDSITRDQERIAAERRKETGR